MLAPIVVPHTPRGLRFPTAKALADAEVRWSPVELDPDDDTAYYRLFSEQWDEGRTFVIVEQDIVVRPHTIINLLRCPKEWCAFPYPYFNGEYPGLGCMKFTSPLIERNWTLPGVIAERRYPGHEVDKGQHWCVLDDAIQRSLEQRGERLHVHQPAVGHVRDYEGSPRPSHDCHRSEP